MIRRSLFLFSFLACMLSVNAQAYKYSIEYEDASGLWVCDMMETISDGKILRLQLACKRNTTCVISMLPNEYRNFGKFLVNKGKQVQIQLHLSNGEILTTSFTGGESMFITYGAQSLRSNKVNLGSNDISYAMKQLRNYNITKIVVDGNEFTTPKLRSAATIDAMCKSLISKTGDQGQYGNGSSTTSGITSQNSSSAASNIPASASISNVNVLHDQTVKGEKGMTITMKLNVNGMKGKELEVTAYFYDENGVALEDKNQKYWTVDKKVCSLTNPSATYDNCVWETFSISIPYRELHMSELGRKTVKYEVIAWNKEVNPIKKLCSTGKLTTSFYNDPYYLMVNGSALNTSVSFNAKGGSKKISVATSAGSYDVWGVPSWCKVENKTATSFDLSCTANAGDKRTDYLKVKADDKEVRVDVSQDKASGPMAIINNLWVDHNVKNGLAKGMKIHVNLDVVGMQGRNVAMCVFYYQSNNTTQLYDGYGRTITYKGMQRVDYQTTNFSDWWCFIPYSYIYSAVNRTSTCSLNVEIQDEYNRLLTYKKNIQFSLY